MITLGVTFGGSWLATRGGGAKKDNTPPINASSKDEENFIQYVSGPLTSDVLWLVADNLVAENFYKASSRKTRKTRLKLGIREKNKNMNWWFHGLYI